VAGTPGLVVSQHAVPIPSLHADALPVLMALLCLFHVLWFVPYGTGGHQVWHGGAVFGAANESSTQQAGEIAAGKYSIEGTGLKYDCDHVTELRVANYSLFALFGLAAVNEAVMVIIGLRGEE
jgi:hypothetical protein